MHWQVCVLLAGAIVLQGAESQEIPPFLQPGSTDYVVWLNNATDWQASTLASMDYDPLFPQSVYNQATAAWAQDCFVQLHVMIYDGRIYNRNPLVSNLSLVQYLNDVENRTGPVDAIVLWYQLPAVGLDSRSQLQLLQGIPGGAETLRELATEVAERNPSVALMVGYVPWDIYTTPGTQPDNSTLTYLLYNSTASGIVARDTPFLDLSFFWYNASSGEPAASFVLQGEGPLTVPPTPWTPLSFTAMTSTSTGFDTSPYSSYRWLEDRHTPLYGSLWSKNKTLAILSAFISGAGTQFSEHVFGFSNIITPRDAALMLRANTISRYLSPIVRYSAYRTGAAPLPDGIPDLHWLPYYPSATADVVVSAFYAACPSSAYEADDSFRSAYDVSVLARRAKQRLRRSDTAANCTVFLLANYGATDAIDIQVNVSVVTSNMAAAPIYWYDMYLGQTINSSESSLKFAPFVPGTVTNMTLTTSIEAGGIGAIFASSVNTSASLQSFLTLMSVNITVAPLASYDATWAPLAQTMSPIVPTPGFSTAPESMVLVSGMQGYAWQVDAVLPYMFYEPSAGNVASSVGVDVQYPWETVALAEHAATFDIAPFYMDVFPVTNEDYRLFLLGSGYVPFGEPNNFLRNWMTYPNGTWSYNATAGDAWRPVTWVSLPDAQMFCAWKAKRLPSEVEWQYAAQAAVTGESQYTVFPWGNQTCAQVPGACPEPDTSRSPRSPEPIGNHTAGSSPLGINDLVGNVWHLTDSFCDVVACAVVLRGGSLYQPPSSYYLPQAQDNYHHVKLPYYDDSSVRSAYVGFRCVADTPLSLKSSHAHWPISG